MIDIYKIWDEASVCGCTMRRMVVVQGFVHPEAIKNHVRHRTRTVRSFPWMFKLPVFFWSTQALLRCINKFKGL